MNTQTKNDPAEYYIYNEHWLSDFDFFSNELNFFEKLLERSIIFSADDDNLKGLQQLQSRLSELKSSLHLIRMSILTNMKDLNHIILKTLPAVGELKNKNESLRERVMAFINKYRIYKNDLFHFPGITGKDPETDLVLTL